MPELSNAPDTGGGEAVTVVTPAADTGANISVSQAARALQSARFKKPEPAPSAVNDAARAALAGDDAPLEELSPEDNAAPAEEQATGETQEGDPAAEPPLDLPRSWTKDQTEHWAKLDRATQEFLLEHDRKASEAVRRSQNEAAEKLKGLTAKEQAVEQAKQQYEAALPALLKTLQQQQAGQFSDIQSMADVEKLASEDPFRFSLWQAQQMKIAAVKQEVDLTQARQTQDQQQQWSKFAEEQDKLAIERIPDLADKAKASKLQDTVAKYLEGIGFTNDELGKNWNGERVFRDARMQQILLDAARYADLKAKPPVPTRPVPQVQRPGVSQPRGASDEQAVQHLNTKFERTGNLKDAAALLTAKRAAARR
jgi:uncharacterized protein (DUF1697 family)